MLLYNRPDYTRTVLEALRQCDGIEDYLLLPHIEPGNEEVLELVKAVQFANVRITLNPQRLGIGRNTHAAWEHGFRTAEFIVHIEDDTVPAPDCLRYMEHCRQAYENDGSIFSVASYNRSPCDPSRYYAISRRPSYTCWLIGVWKNRWEWAKNRWSSDVEKYATHLSTELAKYRFKEVYPLLSRSQNIGAERGTFVPSPEWHQKFHHTEHWSGNRRLPTGNYYDAEPRVTAVMITGLHQARYSLARVALECFRNQTYPNTELLIVNHGATSLFCQEDQTIRELRLSKSEWETIGDLRNIGIEHATGDFIITWDDDDWHHPNRIRLQLEAWRKGCAVFLKNRIHYSFINGCAYYVTAVNGIDATILHPKNCKNRYPSLARKSDTLFANQFEKRIIIDNNPLVYVRFHHGLNLWDARHIMGRFADPTFKNQIELNPDHTRELREVLAKYKNWETRSGD